MDKAAVILITMKLIHFILHRVEQAWTSKLMSNVWLMMRHQINVIQFCQYFHSFDSLYYKIYYLSQQVVQCMQKVKVQQNCGETRKSIAYYFRQLYIHYNFWNKFLINRKYNLLQKWPHILLVNLYYALRQQWSH